LRCEVSAGQGYADIGGLDSGTVREKEVAEGYGVRDAELGSRIFVVLLDASSEVGEGLLDAFAGEAGRLGAGNSFAGGSGQELVPEARLDVALGLQHGEDLFGLRAGDFQGGNEVADRPGQRTLGVLEETEGGLGGDGRKGGALLLTGHAFTLSQDVAGRIFWRPWENARR
jgi:hypothetical protein